jgi:hypothetical protein
MVLYNLRHVEDHEHGLVNFGEDNGLVGIWFLLSNTSRDAAIMSVDVLSYSKLMDPHEANGPDKWYSHWKYSVTLKR